MQFMCILRIFSNILLLECCTIYDLNLINIMNTDFHIQTKTLETETRKKNLTMNKLTNWASSMSAEVHSKILDGKIDSSVMTCLFKVEKCLSF